MSYQPKKMNKFVATAAGVAVVASAIAPAAGAAWTNTPDWMKDSLQDLVNYGVIDADSTVSATGEVTRGEVALYFARALKLDMENVKNPGFSDVPTSHKYYNAIAALAAADKMNGTEKGFEPDRVINRAEMASLIVKAFDYKYGNGQNLAFTDLKGADWARNAIAGLTDAGIKLGQSETKFAPLSKLTRQDTVGFLWKVMKDQGIDFAVVEKQVDTVTAVTKTGVDVVFPKVEDAREDVTITVVDPKGNEVAVKPVNLEKGDAEISFTFEKELDEVALGIWVVGGVEFDTAAVAAVDEVLEASNQVELYKALSSKYFKNVKSDNIIDYQKQLADADDEDKNTVEKIQKIINTVNNDIVTIGDKEDAVKAVKEAKNQLQLVNALKEFARVNSDWITPYEAAYKALELADDVEEAYEQIETMINDVNVAKVDETIADAIAGLDADDVEEAIELVEDYIKTDDVEKKETAKADRIKNLEKHAALISITKANTNAKLQNAFNAYADLDEDFDTEIINDQLLREYRTEIAKVAAEDKNTIEEIITILERVHTDAIADAVAEIAALGEKATASDVKAAFQKLADASKTTDDKFDMDTVVEESLEDYLEKLLEDGTTIETQADVEGVIAFVNNPTNAFAELATALAGEVTADELYELLQDNSLTLTNLVEKNKDQYLAGKDLINDVVAGITTDSELTDDEKSDKVAAIKDVITASNAIVEINKASTVSAMKAELDKLAVAGVSMTTFNADVTEYINLSTTAKLEVAELVLDNQEEDFTAMNEVVTAMKAQMDARTQMLADINGAGFEATNFAMDQALEGLEYDAYDKLSAVDQIAVAEAFINNFPTKTVDNEEVQVDYKTLTAIKADIDKAIAQVK